MDTEHTQRFVPGQHVLWREQLRGGYGYVVVHEAVVVRLSAKRIIIAVETVSGEVVERAVRPTSLSERTPSRHPGSPGRAVLERSTDGH